jgi:hypothetical protein
MWNPNANQTETDWRALASDLQRRVDLLSGALDEIRDVVRRLAAEAVAAPEATEAAVPAAGATVVAVAEPPAIQPEPAPASVPASLPAVDAGWSGLDTWRPATTDKTPSVKPQSAADAAWSRDTEGWAASMPSAAESEPVMRPEAEIGASAAPALDEEEQREQVRRAVEQLRAELGGTAYEEPLPASEVPEIDLQTAAVGDMDAVRDEVRRAVEAARSEIDAVRSESHAGYPEPESSVDESPAYEPPAPPEEPSRSRFEMPAEPPARFDDKALAASTIVIEDSDGRVELVRVYDALSRIECAEQALLLNYTPHSVTVGLGMAPLPDVEALKSAVSQVFERRCDAVIDGARASVTLTGGHYRAA